MDNQLKQIREQQKESWNKFSPGWKKWDKLSMEMLKPMGEEIIRLISPKDGEMILDIAAGTGEPGLTIASMIPNGKVIITDLAEDMLKIAMGNAAIRNIKNFETIACDVCELPFKDDTFDAVSCRFGFMFFPDMNLAAKEIVRVLKPGGRIAASVWNAPEKNFWVTVTMDSINKNIQLPTPLPGSPGMFRCANEGLMTELFIDAGLRNVLSIESNSKLKSGTAEIYWEMMTEIAALIITSLNKADEAMKEKIKKEVFASIDQKFPDGNVVIDCSALVIYGEK